MKKNNPKIERKIYSEIKKNFDNEKILLLLWARQVWKTTILKSLEKDFKDKIQTSFLTLENPEILKRLNENPDNIFNLIWLKNSQDQIIFIDEIQYLDNPTNFLKYIYDQYSENVKLVVTWSSSFYIDQKFKDSLIWRKKIFNIYTLDFFEFLDFKNESKLKEKILNNKSVPLIFKSDFDSLFLEYITFGWYPEIVLLEDKEEKISRLKDYAFDYIKKDIFDAKISDQEKFFDLIKILSSQTWELVNNNEIANTLNLSSPTVEKFLYVLQKSFIISLIKPFHTNIRKELTKMKKVYFYDLWLRNVFLWNFENIENRMDKWWYLENIIFKEFLYKLKETDGIKFWRNQSQNEVDFVIDWKEAFEVKFSEKLINKKKYKKFLETYEKIPLEFLTFENFFEEVSL